MSSPSPQETWDALLLSVYVVSTLSIITVVLINLQAAVYLTKNFDYVVLIVLVAALAVGVSAGIERVKRIRVLRERVREGVLSYTQNDVSPGVTKQDITALVDKGVTNYLRSSDSVIALNLAVKAGVKTRKLSGEFAFLPGYLYSETRVLRVEVISI